MLFKTQPFPKQYTLLSNNVSTQQSTVFIGLVVSGILDIPKLENAHRELVCLWPALGGELVISKTPYEFTSGDIVNFNSRHLSLTRAELPLVTTTQTSSNSKPTVYRMAEESDKLFHFDTMEKFPPPDTIFALRVTVLLDATLLGFRLTHHLCDGEACFDVVKAYSDLINGRRVPELVPPPDIESYLSEQVHGEDCSPPTVSPDNSAWIEKNLSVGVVAILMYTYVLVVRLIMVRLGLRESDEERMIHLPVDFVAKLREECQGEIDAAYEREKPDVKGLEVTRNNVITAWLLKSLYSKFAPSTKIGLDISISINYRPYISSPLPNTKYLHNSFYNTRTPFASLAQFQSLSTSQVALELKKTCVRNKQPSVVRSNINFLERVNAVATPHPPDRILGIRVEHEMPMFSHWTTFQYHLLDFSGALVDFDQNELQRDGRTGSGKVVYTLPSAVFPYGFKMRPLGFFVKDGMGGYWLRMRLSMTGWKGVEESIGS
ncbi:hypothetical protein BDQ17DRAFT_1433427 [Cyathus striatus]|nr:hypothetical protein BDQ17DRAFT_1433427 [Cyathus striatus]